MATLILQYRSADLTGNTNDQIASWADNSGNGLTGTQSTAGNRPLVQKYAGGVRAAKFNGTSRSLVIPTNSLLNYDDTAGFSLAAYVSIGINDWLAISSRSSGSVFGISGTGSFARFSKQGGVDYVSSRPVADGLYRSVIMRWKAGVVDIFVGGVNVLSQSGASLSVTTGTIELGRNPGSSAEYWNGYILEYRQYSDALTNGEVATVHSALAAYGQPLLEYNGKADGYSGSKNARLDITTRKAGLMLGVQRGLHGVSDGYSGGRNLRCDITTRLAGVSGGAGSPAGGAPIVSGSRGFGSG